MNFLCKQTLNVTKYLLCPRHNLEESWTYTFLWKQNRQITNTDKQCVRNITKIRNFVYFTLWVLEPDFEGLCKHVWIQMRRHRTWRLIRIQTVCYSDSGLRKKIEENANFRNLADDILADDKFPSMQRG